MKKEEISADKFLRHDDENYRLMFDFYKKHPDLAAMDLLNQDLAPFQRKIIKGSLSHSFVINVLARGSGKTRMEGVMALLEAMFNPNKRVGFLAPGFRSAKLAFTEFEAIIQESDIAQASIKKISHQTDMWTAELYNGAKVFALPLAADSKMSIRGTRLHTALIDEYPHVPKETIDAIITPMLATQRNPMESVRRIEKEEKMIKAGLLREDEVEKVEKNRVVGLSSAYFQYNHMYQSIVQYKELAAKQKAKTGKTDYAVYTFNYKDAPKGFFDADMIAHAKATSAEIVFRMEYESEFPSDSEGFFKRSLLDSCISHGNNSFSLEDKGKSGFKYFMGIDPARNHDAFAISILKLVNGEMHLVRVLSFDKVSLPIIAGKIRDLLKDYDFYCIGMDAGGGGLAMKDLLADPMTAATTEDIIIDMEEEHSSSRPGRKILKMIDFSSSWITQANFDMRTSLEHKKLLFPNISLGDTFIKPTEDINDTEDNLLAEFAKTIEEMQSIIITATKTGVMHFDTPNQRMRKDRYSSTLIAHKILYDFIKEGYKPRELAMGGWLTNRGISTTSDEENVWTETKIIDQIRNAARERYTNHEDAAL